jgi:hypothetical protein
MAYDERLTTDQSQRKKLGTEDYAHIPAGRP